MTWLISGGGMSGSRADNTPLTEGVKSQVRAAVAANDQAEIGRLIEAHPECETYVEYVQNGYETETE